MTITRLLLKVDGTSEALPNPLSIAKVEKLIGADVLDSVLMKHLGNPLHVMLLDDLGHSKNLPVNNRATAFYLANCHPGTTHEIRGDVVIVPDSDFSDVTQDKVSHG